MGQPITVTQKPTTRSDVVRFELNRSLTGMGHEHYLSASDVTGERPPDVLAARLFEREGIQGVHVFSNEITVDLAPGASSDGILELIHELFIHYRPGVQPTVL